MNRSTIHAIVAAISSCLLSIGTTTAAPIYHVTDIGNLLGGSSSEAYGINASGQIVGYSHIPDGQGGINLRAFLYSNGQMTDLGTLGGSSSEAYAINDAGQVVGASLTSGNQSQHAFVYQNGVMTDLGTLQGSYGTTSVALAINRAGQIVGQSAILDGVQRHAFVFSGGAMTDLGTLGGFNSGASGINNLGQIVGNGDITGPYAFIYANGVMHSLGPYPGASPSAINDTGQVVGSWGSEAFLYSMGTFKELGTLPAPYNAFGYAKSINDSGEIVGDSETTSRVGHAYLWKDGAMHDLNNLLDGSGNGWTLRTATAINDNGWIVSYGENSSGQADTLLLTPVPEPSTLVLLGFGAVGLLAVARRAFSGHAHD